MIYEHKILNVLKSSKILIYFMILLPIYLIYETVNLMIKDITSNGEPYFLSIIGVLAAIILFFLSLYITIYTDKIYEKEIVMIRLFKKTERVYIRDILESGRYLNKKYMRMDHLGGKYTYELSFRDKDNKRYVIKNINMDLFEALESVGFKTPEITNK